ncbi:hypothetical protein [Nocardia sp. NPDC051570]|uniref:hypothetical protein n=1 Tax=Nocardia sp. NPDC051570 TaxID=3364324 RepID=UPI0037A7D873
MEHRIGDPGKGSYTDRQSKKIVIDSTVRDDPVTTVELLSHEAGHASYDGKTIGPYSSTNECVNDHLTDEGAATLNNIVVEHEITENRGPDIGVAGENPDVAPSWNAAYDDYRKAGSTPEAYQHAIARIGAYYGDNLHPSTAPDKTYRQYYQDSCK